MKALIELGLAAFLLFTLSLVATYFIQLIEKIVRPNFKNLDTASFIWLGGLIAVFLVVDVVIIRRWILKARKK